MSRKDGIRFLQLDVFTERAGGGNSLGVVIGMNGWDADDMQRFATWTNLVETTYLLPPTAPGASYRLRIFTPSREIPFAGHPTIGSAHAALATGFVEAAPRLVQQCGAGLLPILVEGEGAGRQLFVQSPPARVLREGVDADPQLRAILGAVKPGARPPAFVEGGRRWWVAEFADEAELRGWHPHHEAIRALALASNSLGLCAFARVGQRDYDLVVRAFPAGVGIVEDPASGAANGLIAAYLAATEPDGALARGYRVSQGRELGKDARILVRIDEDGVWVGGRSHVVIDGRLDWPRGAG
ncbi:MAG: PhzF family phenazine biosynthesis protein [Lysobacteraceae bacterium]